MPVLWDVIEEHVDEAEFCLAFFERALDSALYTLDEVARGPEARLLAHLDALVVGGPQVVQQTLRPQIEDPSDAEPHRVAAVALALLLSGERELAAQGLLHESAEVRRGTARAFAMAPDAEIDSWVFGQMQAPASREQRVALLEVAAARGIVPSGLPIELQSVSTDELVAAASAARWGDPSRVGALVERLLEHPDAEVRNAALLAGLHHRSPRAWGLCKELAFAPEQPHPLALQMTAALGGPDLHNRLVELLQVESHRCAVVRALGLSGSVSLMPTLLSVLASENLVEAKLAAEAIATITGLDTSDERFQIDEAATSLEDEEEVGGEAERANDDEGESDEEDRETYAALPALEDDDLDADLVPPPEDDLPAPDASAIAEWWHEEQARFDARARLIGGLRLSVASMLDVLAVVPTRRRHLLARVLAVRSSGRARVDTRALTQVQLQQMRASRATETPTQENRRPRGSQHVGGRQPYAIRG